MTRALHRRFKVDVSSDASTWIPLKGINDLADSENATLQSTADYDSGGFDSFEKTLTGAKLVAKVTRIVTAGIPSDPGQELCRGTRFQSGTGARVYVRWYDRNGAPEAYQCQAIVDWNPSKSGAADVEEITITFTADGPVTLIANPNTASSAPTVVSVSPSGAAAGALITIIGTAFTGVVPATGVKIGGVTAPGALIQSDSQIVVAMPAGTAGSAPVIVTNGVGASNSFPYTRA